MCLENVAEGALVISGWQFEKWKNMEIGSQLLFECAYSSSRYILRAHGAE
jgi:hypothetical protein